jgi:hypothetical protein
MDSGSDRNESGNDRDERGETGTPFVSAPLLPLCSLRLQAERVVDQTPLVTTAPFGTTMMPSRMYQPSPSAFIVF